MSQHQGSSRGRDARDGSLNVSAAAGTRWALEAAKATTLRRKGRLHYMQRDIAEAESAEREAAAAAAKAQHALDRDIWTAASGAAATPLPLTREQGINSRFKRPRDDAFWTGSVACMASKKTQEPNCSAQSDKKRPKP